MENSSVYDLRVDKLDSYTNDSHPLAEFNRCTIKAFSQYKIFQNFDMFDFLNTLFTIYLQLITENDPKPDIIATPDFDSLDDRQTYVIIYLAYIIILIHKPPYETGAEWVFRMKKIPMLKDAMEALETRLPFTDIGRPEGIFRFDNVKRHLDSLINLSDKCQFLSDIIADYVQYRSSPTNHFGTPFDPGYDYFFTQCQNARNVVEIQMLGKMEEGSDNFFDRSDDKRLQSEILNYNTLRQIGDMLLSRTSQFTSKGNDGIDKQSMGISLTLKDIVKNDRYDELLQKLDSCKLIDQDSKKWIDRSSGYRKLAAAIIQSLYVFNYTKENVSPLPANQVQNILEDLGIKISISTIKHALQSVKRNDIKGYLGE